MDACRRPEGDGEGPPAGTCPHSGCRLPLRTSLQINLRKERQRQRQRQQQIRLQRTSSGAGAAPGTANPLARLSNWTWGLERPSGSAVSPSSDVTATTPVSGRPSALARLHRATSGVFSSPRAATPGSAGTPASASPGGSARRTTTGGDGMPASGLRRSSAMLMPRTQSAPEVIATALVPAAGRALLPHLEEASEAVVVVSIPEPSMQEPDPL